MIYRVQVRDYVYGDWYVEAKDEAEALGIAETALCNGDTSWRPKEEAFNGDIEAFDPEEVEEGEELWPDIKALNFNKPETYEARKQAEGEIEATIRA